MQNIGDNIKLVVKHSTASIFFSQIFLMHKIVILGKAKKAKSLWIPPQRGKTKELPLSSAFL